MFKIGEKVRYVSNNMPEFKGQCGTIEQEMNRCGGKPMFRVRLNDPKCVPDQTTHTIEAWADSLETME